MVAGILCSLCCFIFLTLDHYFLNNPCATVSFNIALLCKMLASACFVIYGLLCFSKCKDKNKGFKKVSSLMLSGLFLGFAADLLLEINFYAGFVVFVTAHIFYFLGFSVYSKMDKVKWAIVIGFVAVFATVDYVVPWFNFQGLFPVVVIYSAVWAFVFAKSVESLKFKSVNAKIVVAGIVLFGISDILLQFKFFPAEGFSPAAGAVIFAVSNAVYYIAQLLIGYSLSKNFIDYSSPFQQ